MQHPFTLDSFLNTDATYGALSAHLDALAPSERLRQVLALRGPHVGALYAAVADAPPLTLEDLVSDSLALETPCILVAHNVCFALVSAV